MKLGLSEAFSTGIAETIATLSLILLSLAAYFLVKFILKKTVYKFIQLSTNKYDDLLIKNKVITRICLLIPTIITSSFLNEVLPDFLETAAFLTKLINILEIMICSMVISL